MRDAARSLKFVNDKKKWSGTHHKPDLPTMCKSRTRQHGHSFSLLRPLLDFSNSLVRHITDDCALH